LIASGLTVDEYNNKIAAEKAQKEAKIQAKIARLAEKRKVERIAKKEARKGKRQRPDFDEYEFDEAFDAVPINEQDGKDFLQVNPLSPYCNPFNLIFTGG
jgi:hypothetical protein